MSTKVSNVEFRKRIKILRIKQVNMGNLDMKKSLDINMKLYLLQFKTFKIK